VDVRECDVDFLCSGTYKGLLAGFGIAPFYIRQSLWDRVPPDRFGVFQVTSQTPDFHFELRNNARRYDYATLPFAEVHQLGASLAYLEKVGIPRIEQHTMGLTTRLRDGLLRQGFRLFTPPENRASITSFYVGRPAEEVRATFAAEKIDVTVRTDHVRASVAVFNNAEEIDRLLAVTPKLH
jgi:selenocysteine lyase/cysteine desulfurase